MNAQVTHTPGPWRYYFEGKCFYVAQEDGAPFTAEASDVGHGIFQSYGIDTHAREEGNARLIAAAPTMLDALQTALYYLNIGESATFEARIKCVEQVRAAIAKAQP